MDWEGMIIVFLLNSVIGIYITERIKNNFEQKILLLQQENNIEIAKLNNELNQLTSIHNIQFGELQQRRATAIVEVYKMLVKAERRLKSEISPITVPKIMGEPTPLQKYKTLRIDIVALLIYIEDNKILFSQAQSELLDNIHDIFDSIDNTFYFKALFDEYPASSEERLKAREKEVDDWIKDANEKYSVIYPKIKMSLENDFRMTLGFDIKS